MYIVPLKAMLVTALKRTFDAEYPEPDFRNVHASMEYPVERAQYPGIWVDYDDTAPLQTAGVDHSEVSVVSTTTQRYLRWKYAGYVSYTVSALTSYERDRLYDELIRVLAFGRTLASTKQFRSYVENNDLIAANFNFDEIQSRGNAVVPGTPWGTDEIIYERTLNMDVVGEFVSDAETGLLVPLSAVLVLPPDVYLDPDEVPAPPDSEEGWI